MDACLSANGTSKHETKPDQSNGLERLWEEKSLLDLYPSLATRQGDLVFSISKWLPNHSYLFHCFFFSKAAALFSYLPQELLYSLKAQEQG
jgi:uncharacterized membrane protein